MERHLHDGHHRFFASILHGKGNIFVMVGNFGFRVARRSKQRREMGKLCAIADQSFGMNTIGRVVWMNEASQINSLLAVRRETHYFPFITVGNKAEEAGELRIEKAERVGPIESENMLEASRAAMPN